MPAAIFDLDGTLVDLFELHLRGFRHVISSDFGLEFARRDLEADYGKPGEDIFRGFFLRKGILVEDVKSLADRRRSWVLGHLDGCVLMPGAKGLLEALRKAGVPMALGTSNPPELGEAIIGSCGLSGYFPHRSYGDPDGPGKPAPDIFLNAARLLGAPPRECAVFEDSVWGIQAAKAAGMRAVAVATGTHGMAELAAQKPDIIVSSLQEVDVGAVLEMLR
jgi:beta-phosphoglucomutase-like phosphatase (HAD superfamily)